MIRPEWMAALGTMFVLWYESAENPFVFCYRMVLDFFARLGAMEFAKAQWAHKGFAVCSRVSASFSTRSTTLKD